MSDETEPRARETAEEALPGETDVVDTVRCDGICDREVFEAGVLDVVVGQADETLENAPYATVRGTGDGPPVREQWCVTCAKDQFDVDVSANTDAVQRARRYVTAHTATAFAIGVALTALVLLVIAV